MEAKKLDLKVDEEFRRLCPAMGKETRQKLERLLSQGGSTPLIRTWNAMDCKMGLSNTSCAFARGFPIPWNNCLSTDGKKPSCGSAPTTPCGRT